MRLKNFKFKISNFKFLIVFIFFLYSLFFFLYSNSTSAQGFCDSGTSIARANGLVSVVTDNPTSKFLLGTGGACIIDTKSAFATFKVATYSELLNTYFQKAKNTATTNLIKTNLTSSTPFNSSSLGGSSSGLVAYWSLNEGTGTTVADSSGNGYNGTFSGTTPFWAANSKFGNGASFNGANIIRVSNLPAGVLSGSWTQSFWMKTSSNTISVLAEKGTNNGLILLLTDGQIRAFNTGSDLANTTGLPTVIDNKWYMVTTTFNSTSKLMKIYINGVQRGSQTLTSNAISIADPYVIGARNGGAAPFTGQMDEISIWNKDLSQAEISDLYSNFNLYNYTDTGTVIVPAITGNITSPKTTVVFVNGNLNITGNIAYTGNDAGGALGNNTGLLFVVQGDVFIQDTVTEINADIVSYGTICTAATGGATPICPVAYNTALSQLKIYGNLSSMTTAKPIKFLRNNSNPLTPGELIIAQPKYFYVLKNIFAQDLIITSQETVFPSPTP